MTHYPRAPITEAVIEIRFQEQVANDLVEKVRARLGEHYQIVNPVGMRTVQVNVASVVAQQTVGYRANNLDGVDVVIISAAHLSVSRLAPYTGWEVFFARARRDWDEWKRSVGYRKIQRIGIRYINRIDIPVEPGQRIDLDRYFTCYPEVPESTGFPLLSNYAMQLVLPGGPDGCSLIINGASVPSPVLGHISILLDLDISKEGDVPQKDDELWELIGRIRGYKNTAFESCITETTRKLFF